MTFELVRIGWPNTAAILALAIMPVVSLSTLAPDRAKAGQAQIAKTATICPTSAYAVVARTTGAGVSLE